MLKVQNSFLLFKAVRSGKLERSKNTAHRLKGVSVTLSDYENFYKETLRDLNGKKNFKIPIPALAYFDKLTGDMYSLNNFKKKVNNGEK